jgi:hypothetical protein
MFRRRIGGVVVVVEDGLGEHAKKNSFHTRKKICFLMITRVRSWLAYPKNTPFPICFWFVEITQGAGQREYRDLKE